MAQFQYQAVTDSGQNISGTLEALDRRSALAALAGKGHFVTSIVGGSEKAVIAPRKQTLDKAPPRSFAMRPGKVTGKDVLSFVNQLSAAIRAGLPMLDCLQIIRRQSDRPAVGELIRNLEESVSAGDSLSDAMGHHPKHFRPLHCALVRVGETGGLLDQTMLQLSQLLKRDETIKSSMKNAAAYPIFILTLGFLAVIVIMTWLLPTIIATIDSPDFNMPWPTRLLMAISAFIRNYYYSLPSVVIIIALLYGFKKWIDSSGRIHWDGFKLKIPILGSVLRCIAVGRFSRTLGSLTKGGVTILEALQVVRDTLGNEVLGREIDDVTEKVRVGASLAEPLEESGRFPHLLVQIISVGEQTGKLDELLLTAAETFDDDADAAIERFMAIMPAVLVLLLAVVIGFIIVATILPIWSLQMSVGGF
ncbi:MAG: type II secretion system F family protein [Planctomycetes bacterium]|nr:type II secretion system F family protein [Planctomycetota bacterium]